MGNFQVFIWYYRSNMTLTFESGDVALAFATSFKKSNNWVQVQIWEFETGKGFTKSIMDDLNQDY